MAERETDTQPWYRQFWPWFIMLLPATVVVASIVTLMLAASQPLEVEPGWEKRGKAVIETEDAPPVETAEPDAENETDEGG